MRDTIKCAKKDSSGTFAHQRTFSFLEALTNKAFPVPLRPCQAIPQAEHPTEDARGSQGCRLRYSCSRVPDCWSLGVGRRKSIYDESFLLPNVDWHLYDRTLQRTSRSSVLHPATSSLPSVVMKSSTLSSVRQLPTVVCCHTSTVLCCSRLNRRRRPRLLRVKNWPR
jgi:hypothetical protein